MALEQGNLEDGQMVTEKTYRSWCCRVKFLRVVLKNAEPNASQEWRDRLQQKMDSLNAKIDRYEKEIGIR
jgi:hypothetical protein